MNYWVHLLLGLLFALSLARPALATGDPCRRVGNAIIDEAFPYSDWLGVQESKAVAAVNKHISGEGAVVAAATATSDREPNYSFHWTRDSAIVMNGLVDRYLATSHPHERAEIMGRLLAFASFSRKLQLSTNRSGSASEGGLGEPRFKTDGTADWSDWAFPQYDGPALRAIALVRVAEILIEQGNPTLARTLYDGKLPTESVIKADLEFVLHHWTKKSVDLWEEGFGHHFHTRIVQRKALLAGAQLARRLGDAAAAKAYEKQADAIETALNLHWDAARGYVQSTLGQEWGKNKPSNLDLAVVLGVLQGHVADRAFSVLDPKVMATVHRLHQTSKRIYKINEVKLDRDGQPMEAAIGRYEEDLYDAHADAAQGHPWVLATATFAEYHFRLRTEIQRKQEVTITDLDLSFWQSVMPESTTLRSGMVLKKGDAEFEVLSAALTERGHRFLRRVRYHTPPDGSLAEQINRETGYMQGARDLTWSNSSYLSALAASRVNP